LSIPAARVNHQKKRQETTAVEVTLIRGVPVQNTIIKATTFPVQTPKSKFPSPFPVTHKKPFYPTKDIVKPPSLKNDPHCITV
jgi:hypothetical protein